jgi:peroxiredoxin
MAQKHPHLGVGDLAPPFALRSDDGQEIQLAAVLRSSAAIVVFIRGTW